MPCAIFFGKSGDDELCLVIDELDADEVGRRLQDCKKGFARLEVDRRSLWLSARNVWYVEDRPRAEGTVDSAADAGSNVDAELRSRLAGTHRARHDYFDPARTFEQVMDAAGWLRGAWERRSSDLGEALDELRSACEAFSAALSSQEGRVETAPYRDPLADEYRR